MYNEYDVWNPLANFLADMIEKYASELDFENMSLVEISNPTALDSSQSIEIVGKV